LAISAAASVAALKNVDFPVFGFPMTPNSREYDAGMVVHFVFIAFNVSAFGKTRRLPPQPTRLLFVDKQ
jgi:hypothetical protein